MEPQFQRTRSKSAFLIEALRSYISALRNHAYHFDSLFGKPAKRVHDKLRPHTPSLRLLSDSHQTDLSDPGGAAMAADITLNFSMLGHNQDNLGTSTTTLLNPGFI